MKYIFLTAVILSFASIIKAQEYSHYIVVAQDGSGNYKTITEAVQSLPMFNYERVVIFIKNGVYKEKIRLTQDYITLRGENKEKTIIEYCQLRSDWDEKKDSIGPAVINIFADDIILENLTIKNTQTKIGPHAFTIYGQGTRIITLNCNIHSLGGDTVSLWNYKTGMYYHADCKFSGAVDFVCPRGWCYITNSEFYQYKQTASIWHAGGYNQNQKLVITNSFFDGVKNFELGRHHYDMQFYLINCTFSANLKDTPIYRVVYADPQKNRPFNWGERYYFYNCHRNGGDFKWFKDNLSSAVYSPKPADVTCSWTFDKMWDPESAKGPYVIRYAISSRKIDFEFNDIITVIGKPVMKSSTGKIFTFDSGNGSVNLRFNCNELFSDGDLQDLKIINDAKITGTTASVTERPAEINVK